MGLFSRRRNVRPAEAPTTVEGDPGEARGATPTSAADPETTSRPEAAEAGASESARASSGLVVHSALQAALAGWAREKNSVTLNAVIKECAAGELLLDLTRSTLADPAAGPQQGDVVAIAHQVDNAGKRLLLAFSSNDRLARYREADAPVSLAQPASSVIEQAVREYEGIALDPGSPDTQFIAYADELTRGLGADVTASTRVAQALADRTLAWPAMLELLRSAPSLVVAEAPQRDALGEVVGAAVVTATGEHGETWSVVHTSPAEAWAWAPGARVRPVSFAEVARTAISQGHAGLVVNPGGPSATVLPDELRLLVEG